MKVFHIAALRPLTGCQNPLCSSLAAAATNDDGGFCSLEMAVQSSRNITETARQRTVSKFSRKSTKETHFSVFLQVRVYVVFFSEIVVQDTGTHGTTKRSRNMPFGARPLFEPFHCLLLGNKCLV